MSPRCLDKYLSVLKRHKSLKIFCIGITNGILQTYCRLSLILPVFQTLQACSPHSWVIWPCSLMADCQSLLNWFLSRRDLRRLNLTFWDSESDYSCCYSSSDHVSRFLKPLLSCLLCLIPDSVTHHILYSL